MDTEIGGYAATIINDGTFFLDDYSAVMKSVNVSGDEIWQFWEDGSLIFSGSRAGCEKFVADEWIPIDETN